MTVPAVAPHLIPARIATVYQFARLINASDDQQGPYAGLFVGSLGNVTVIMRNGDGGGGTDPVTFFNVPAGTLLPIGIQAVTAFTGDANTLLGLG